MKIYPSVHSDIFHLVHEYSTLLLYKIQSSLYFQTRFLLKTNIITKADKHLIFLIVLHFTFDITIGK
jgi:hypothetical protein